MNSWTTLLLVTSLSQMACGGRTDAPSPAPTDDDPAAGADAGDLGTPFPSGTIAVGMAFGGVNFYPPGASSDTPPLGRLDWPADDYVRRYMAFDAQGYLYVESYLHGDAGTAAARVDVFAPGSVGRGTPVRTIMGTATGLVSARALVVDGSGFLFVANGDVSPDSESSIQVFAPVANGDSVPVRSIRPATGGGPSWLPSGIALDPQGDLYVGSPEGPPLYLFAAGTGAQTPIESLGDSSNLEDVSGVAVDPSGRVYASDSAANRVVVFGPDGSGVPLGFIEGNATGLGTPLDIAVDHAGRIYVANEEGGVRMFAPGTTGNVAPVAVLSVASGYNVAVAP